MNSNRRRSQSATRAPPEPFYLHPPNGSNGSMRSSLTPAHAPSDGLYVNPMRAATHNHASSGEESSGMLFGFLKM